MRVLLVVEVVGKEQCIYGEVSTKHVALVLHPARVRGGPVVELLVEQFSRTLIGGWADLSSTLLPLLGPAYTHYA